MDSAFIDYMPCSSCLKQWNTGITLIEVVDDPIFEDQPEIQRETYPTGKWCVVQPESAEQMFGDYLNNQNALFVDQEIFDYIIEGNHIR